MAFHQPTRQALQRTIQTATTQEQDGLRPQTPHSTPHSPLPIEAQTWVLFSPDGNAASSSYSGASTQSLRTAGRSKNSDFGSLDTHIRTDGDLAPHPIALGSHPIALAYPETISQSTLEEDAELDSLDSHLPDFRAAHSPYVETSTNAHSAPVLPRHDGLGSFRLDRPAPAADIQETLYAFERLNPNRVTRHDDVTTVPGDVDPDTAQRMQRIESWSLEQSRLLQEHIQKETRTRRLSHSSAATEPRQLAEPVEIEVTAEPEKATVAVSGEHDHLDWHDNGTQETTDTERRGFLSHAARTFLKDIVGIDERLIAVLLGDSLPGEGRDLSGVSNQSDLGPAAAEEPWQASILERVAKELGILISRVSHHPGAFSTYARMQRMPLPYAGLPVIPETTTAPAPGVPAVHDDGLSAAMPEFQPTMAHAAQAMNMQDSRHHTSRDHAPPSNPSIFSQEEWEEELDVKLVFRYLRSRFGSRSSPSPASAGTSHLATSSTQDAAAKAARVRQYHPLVGPRPRLAERRAFKAAAPAPVAPAALRQPSSASQSTRRSARRSSCSSRHYWDIGGSLGTVSVIASTGPMGSWGEL